MKKLEYKYNTEQFNALSALAYRIADRAYMIERWTYDGAKIELEQNHETIIDIFDDLDNLKVPFWVQNTVIIFAEDWRRFKREYLSGYLKTRNICNVYSG